MQMEMCSDSYVLAMTSVMDSQEGFDRLFDALYEMDGQEERENLFFSDFYSVRYLYGKTKKCAELFDAWERERRSVKLSDACGLIAADFVNLYPPGIPVLVPGEEISAEITEKLTECIRMGLNVVGIDGKMRIKVVN